MALFIFLLYYAQCVATSSVLCLQDGCCIAGHCIGSQEEGKVTCLLNDFLRRPIHWLTLLYHWLEHSYLATPCCNETRTVNIEDFFGIVFDILVSSSVPLKILVLRSTWLQITHLSILCCRQRGSFKLGSIVVRLSFRRHALMAVFWIGGWQNGNRKRLCSNLGERS